MKQRTLSRECHICGRSGTMTFEEPEHDTSGKNTRWIEATGCWRVGADGSLENVCEAANA